VATVWRPKTAAPAPTGTLVYRFRRSVLENEATWTLGPEAIERAEQGAQPFYIPYRDITELRLSYDPTRFDTDRYRCDVTARRLRHPIMSTSYVSVGNFENRNETYVPFVRSLIARAAAVAPNCRFRAGKRPWAYWLQHIFLLSMLILLGVVIATMSGLGVSGMVAVKLGIIAFYIPVAIKYAHYNLPRNITPDSIPAEVLPK